MSSKRKTGLYSQKVTWRGRECYEMGNGLVHLVTLTGGGHIAEFRFSDLTGNPTINPLWNPPWSTIEPYQYRAERHGSRYGSVTEGKLLSGIAGHHICLDYFGPPSEEEAAQGLSFHGEAPISKWRLTNRRVLADEVSLMLSVRLPIAGLRFSREIRLCRGESVAYFTETVVNERKCDHFFHWTQHVTLGPPFLSPSDSTTTLPGTRGLTDPHGYDEGKALVASRRLFRWPTAPGHEGDAVNLTRPFLRRGQGFVVGVLLDARRDIGFVAATNKKLGLMIGYCFRRGDYPWVAVWEENRAITAPPWNHITQARGLEFGTTGLPVPHREAIAMGELMNTPTFACVPARGRKVIRYLGFLSSIPTGFEMVSDIRLVKNTIVILGADTKDSVSLPASGLSDMF
jgi:hypothetical protein